MKKVIFISFLFVLNVVHSQDWIISLGTDQKLIFDGGYEYDHESVFNFSFRTGGRLDNGFEFMVGVEYADLNPSYLSSSIFVNKVIKNRFETVFYSFGVEFLIITRGRYGNYEKINPVPTFGINSEIRFKVLESLYLGLNANLTHRRDLLKMYNHKVFFNFNGSMRLILEISKL